MAKPPSSPLAALRDILVGTTVETAYEEPSSAIGYGLTLAKAAGAHLTVQSASWCLSGDDAWLGSFDLDDDGVARIDRRLDAMARSVADRAAGDAAQAGVLCTTQTPSLPYPDVVGRLVAQASLHDLTVLDAGPRTYDLDREVIEKALLASGRPVIAVPPGHDAFTGRKIIVAWDGSAQAARAANDAMPFLCAADAVEIVCVAGTEELYTSVPGAEFAPHLARHGVTVSVVDVPVVGDTAETLRNQAMMFHADMIVMGAYGHSRVREFFFGGVTRALLRSSPAPLLLAH
jgi:nucleotide-binding universal stress UspA family protein